MRWIAIALLGLLAAGCSSGGPAELDTDRLALSVLDGTRLNGGSGRVFMTTIETPEQLEVSVRVEEARGLKACYFELQYNPEVLNPVAANATQELAASSDAQVLELAVLSEPGKVNFGAVLANYMQQPGMDGAGRLATVTFQRAPFHAEEGKDASATFEQDLFRQRSAMTYTPAGMQWRYAQPGDYDQNGEVNAADLSRLAFFFGQPVDWVNESGIYDTALSVVDGDVNGEVNLADISVIGANFGTQVTGIDVFAVGENELYPAYPVFPSRDSDAGKKVATIPFSSASGDASSERLKLLFPVGEQLHHWIWAQPVTNKGPGLSTRYGWASPRSVGLDLYDQNGYQLQYDPQNNVLTWYYNLWGDLDVNGASNISDITVIGANLNQPGGTDPSTRLWAIDRYRNGAILMDDVQLLFAVQSSQTDGYVIYGTTNSAEIPEDPYVANDDALKLGQVTLDDRLGLGFGSRSYFEFTVPGSSGWYFWVRPYAQTLDNVGTRSGVLAIL